MTVQLEFRLNGEVPVRLFTIKARKFFGLAVILFFTIPFGLSVTGCGHKAAAVVYCNGHDTGPVVGELATIQLEPSLALVGESLNYGQIGPSLSATGYDCKGSVVSLQHINYATSNPTIADINPSTGQACGGTYNRTTSGGVPDYSTCNPPTTTPAAYLSYITATANGISSNALPVYTHATATSIVFGTTKSSCAVDSNGNFIDPDTTCCPPTVARHLCHVLQRQLVRLPRPDSSNCRACLHQRHHQRRRQHHLQGRPHQLGYRRLSQRRLHRSERRRHSQAARFGRHHRISFQLFLIELCRLLLYLPTRFNFSLARRPARRHQHHRATAQYPAHHGHRP